MVTVRAVAERCGVSTATASYVLSGQGDRRRISAATQEKVRRTAEAMGYQRARALSGAPKSTANEQPFISVFWPQRDFEMCVPSITDGMNAAQMAELSPVKISIHSYEQGLLSAQADLWENLTCGSILVIAGRTEDMRYLETNPLPVPAVLLNRDLPGYSSVSIDHQEAGRLAAVHAMRCGGGDLSLVLNPTAPLGLATRGERIIQVCREQSVSLQNRLFYCENRIDDGYDLGREMIRKKKLSRVIICTYDMVGLGIISALNEAGIEVGREVQVLATSTGPQRLFARSYPPMTVVDLRLKEVAERALSVAIGLAAGRLTHPQKIVIQPSIVYRQSCPIPDAMLY